MHTPHLAKVKESHAQTSSSKSEGMAHTSPVPIKNMELLATHCPTINIQGVPCKGDDIAHNAPPCKKGASLPSIASQSNTAQTARQALQPGPHCQASNLQATHPTNPKHLGIACLANSCNFNLAMLA